MLLVHRITNHRHGPAGLQAGIKKSFITHYGSAGLLTGYYKSFCEHYRYCLAGLWIGVTHHYVRRNTAHLTLIGILIYL